MPDEETYDFDLDALVVEVETAAPFKFKWRDELWTMPLMFAMEFADQMALEDADVETSMRLIMGDDQFERFIAAPISTGRMRDLIAQWHKFQGLDPGESQASSRSSKNTARRSKRTSRSGR
jgi:hypothetical protein